ncbi:MAG: hypothetical protein M3323_01575 [Actinomycetota bacterium]|nr:hypothetical protein [Actinomycetota bacterium]
MSATKRHVVRAALVGLVALALVPVTPVGAAIDKSDNLRRTYTFTYEGTVYPPEASDDYFKGGTDMAFSGNLIYAMQQGESGGVHIVKRTRTRRGHVKIGFVPCPGEQNDVEVIERGLIAIGYHSSQCNVAGGGIRLIDVSNPSRPRYLGSVSFAGGTHTLTKYPGKPLIYSSPNGLGNVRGVEQIIDVSNPAKPEVVASYANRVNACHDLTFYVKDDKKLAFCPGSDRTEIWDVSDPLAPVPLSEIVNPSIFYHHSAVATHDGKYLVIGDENTEADECEGGTTGALWVYDIEDPALPTPVSHFGIARGQAPGSAGSDRESYCTSHLYNFIPGTYVMVAAWYAAGINVIDFSDPANPVEIGHYFGSGDDYANYWSAYWHKGRIYGNDRTRGLDVFRPKGLPPQE